MSSRNAAAAAAAAGPSEAELAEFQARAALSMAFLRNLVGRHVEGYEPPTADELAQQADACVPPPSPAAPRGELRARPARTGVPLEAVRAESRCGSLSFGSLTVSPSSMRTHSLPQATVSATQRLVRKLTAKPGPPGSRSNPSSGSTAATPERHGASTSAAATYALGRHAPGPGSKPYGQSTSKAGRVAAPAHSDSDSDDDEDSRARSVGQKTKRSAGDAFGGSAGKGKKKAKPAGSAALLLTTTTAGVKKGGSAGKVHPAVLLQQQQQQQQLQQQLQQEQQRQQELAKSSALPSSSKAPAAATPVSLSSSSPSSVGRPSALAHAASFSSTATLRASSSSSSAASLAAGRPQPSTAPPSAPTAQSTAEASGSKSPLLNLDAPSGPPAEDEGGAEGAERKKRKRRKKNKRAATAAEAERGKGDEGPAEGERAERGPLETDERGLSD